MIPAKIGRYKIIDTIGAGGMGMVYLALDGNFERQVAVKVLPANLCAEAENRERFRREAKSIAMLEHSAVVPVYDYGEEGEAPYLVMRYIPGGSLKDRLTRGRIEPVRAAAILRPIASALDKAHAAGIVHRDIKPANILFDLEDNPYIADFGLAKILESSTQITHSAFFGTPAYTSPEQCRGERTIDGRADIYSLTAMFFQMLTGSPPYDAGNPMALMMKHISNPIPLLADFFDALPEGLQEVINRGMAKEPGERYATAGEMAKAVDRILAGADPAKPAAAQSLWETEKVTPPPPSFDALRKTRPEPVKPQPRKADAQATRRDSPAPARPAVSKNTEAVPAAPPVPRRKLDWTPLPDSAPAPEPDATTRVPREAELAMPEATVLPAPVKSPASLYSTPVKPAAQTKAAGIPLLVLFFALIVIAVLYILVSRGMLPVSGF